MASCRRWPAIRAGPEVPAGIADGRPAANAAAELVELTAGDSRRRCRAAGDRRRACRPRSAPTRPAPPSCPARSPGTTELHLAVGNARKLFSLRTFHSVSLAFFAANRARRPYGTNGPFEKDRGEIKPSCAIAHWTAPPAHSTPAADRNGARAESVYLGDQGTGRRFFH